jgi:peptide/nickel transport system permease protein
MTRSGFVYFVVRRLAAMGLLIVFISFAIFSLLYIAPGNVVDILLGLRPRTPETVRLLRHEYHLDQPFLTQYWIWAKGALRFHFGNSIQTTLPVADEIEARLPTSLYLGVYAYLLTMLLGVAGGVWAALKRSSFFDRGTVAASVVGLSTPGFVSAIFLLYVFAIVVPLFPVFGRGQGFTDTIWHLTLPALALAVISAAYVLKHTRASMINVLDQDYVTFARARGLSGRRITLHYALRNALIPTITISALILSFVITGAVLVEVTFSIPGIGFLLVQSASVKDLPMLQGVAMLIALIVMLSNLLADLVYVAVDPRIRLGRGTA